MMIWLSVLACLGGELTATLVDDLIDECRDVCVTLDGKAGSAWSVHADGELAGEGELGQDSQSRLCLEPPWSPGDHTLTASSSSESVTMGFEVRPFGHAYGLNKPVVSLSTLPWLPVISDLEEEPLFDASAADWHDSTVSAPGVIDFNGQELLFYAGKLDSEDAYRLGLAGRTDPDAPFASLMDDPLLDPETVGAREGDWDEHAQNTPYPLVVDDELWLFYNGKQATGSTRLSIGVATSTDGIVFVSERDPVLSGGDDPGIFDDAGVAHPSVVHRDGVFELFYASGTLQIGHALSADGRTWERYCRGPVFEGSGTWDLGRTKAPDVVYAEGTYWMVYSGCDKGCFEVGWAASTDGLRWVAAAEPLIPRGTTAWTTDATQGGFIDVRDPDAWRVWFSGQADGQRAIGRVTLE
jgi:predicted GH43/DUF377 family glycosyl hydrolase